MDPSPPNSICVDQDHGSNGAGRGGDRSDRGGGLKRPIQSCGECKRRKIKCNKTYPCGPCIIRGDQDVCKEVEKSEAPTGAYASGTEVNMLINRVASLEEQLQTLYRTVESLQRSRSSSATPGRPTDPEQRDVRPPTVVTALGGRTQPDEEVALMLEDFAMGHRVNRDRVAERLKPAAFGSSEYPIDVASPSSCSIALPDDHALSFFLPSGYEPARLALSATPDHQRALFLIHFYFTRLQWSTRTLYAPSFLKECEDLLTLPPEDAARKIRPNFLCVYLMVMCLALHLVAPEEQIALGYSTEQAKDLAKRMFHAAQGMLFASGFLSSHSLEHLQAVVLMGVYQHNLDDSDAHWSLLGSAIKVAQNLGLSRLGAESELRRKAWPAAWRSARLREVGRRTWWCLVDLDWSFATAHSATYCVHPSQHFTAFPSNLNDDDLEDDALARPARPLEEYTESSFSIWKLRFVVLYRELVDHLAANSPASYTFILSMDLKLVQLMDSLPSFFTNPLGLRTTLSARIESIFIGIFGDNRLMRLHRPYLSRSYTDPKYSASKDRCVHAARSILAHIRVAGERAPDLLKNWLTLFLGFAASIVVFIDLTRNPSLETRLVLRETLALFKTAQFVSTAARNAVSLLEGLLAAEAEITQRSPVSGTKRRRIQEDSETADAPFTNVVNRLLLAAASPSADVCRPLSVASSVGASMTGTSTSGIWDFLTPSRGHSQPDLEVFLDGGKDLTTYDGTGAESDLSRLFSSDFGQLFQGYEGSHMG